MRETPLAGQISSHAGPHAGDFGSLGSHEESFEGRRIVLTAFEHFVDVPSGTARVVSDVGRYLAEQGHDVWVVARAVSSNIEEHEYAQNVHLLRYAAKKFNALDPRRAWTHRTCTKAILQRFVPGPVDVVYGHAPLSYLAACELYGGQATTCYTAHSPLSREMDLTWPRTGLVNRLRRGAGLRWLDKIERDCLKESDCVTVLSNYTNRLLHEIHGADLTCGVTVIPGWVDPERFQVIEDRQAAKRGLGWTENVPVFFTLRRLVSRMGLDVLLRVCGLLRGSGLEFQLMIGGDGPMKGSLEGLSKELGLSQHVRFLGRVDNAVLPLMYGACDAFVLPTAQLECFGLIAIEALACGRPVLATCVGAIPEILDAVEPRWIAGSPKEDGLAELLASFLHGGLPEHPPHALRSFVKSRYDDRVILPQLADFLLRKANKN